MLNNTASFMCNDSLMTLIRWNEDTELFVTNNPSTEDFTVQTDNPAVVGFRQFSNEVVQGHKHDTYSHFDLLLSDMSLSAFVLLFGLLTHSVLEGIALGSSINSMETFTALLIRFLLEGFGAGTFIYVACVEILSSEMSVHNHGTRQGLFKALTVIIGVFTFFFVNIIFGQRLHSSRSLSQHTLIEMNSVMPSLETAH
ncbi:hypothetical protein WUBG_00481 [Wuchereria bancrofti]|uniref:Uncharacterized protein n=2 Tax=Wuchereria bancrofti TaxID=6293 RepID=J9F137_WUCBA|nr:hypothetical protein WUBG_00481 [Wuchereria bancrofti]VDM06840.1 unnamed protein product [Wuchereria bancrofti]